MQTYQICVLLGLASLFSFLKWFIPRYLTICHFDRLTELYEWEKSIRKIRTSLEFPESEFEFEICQMTEIQFEKFILEKHKSYPPSYEIAFGNWKRFLANRKFVRVENLHSPTDDVIHQKPENSDFFEIANDRGEVWEVAS